MGVERQTHFLNSQTEEGRSRLLLEAITDYAIYMIDPAGTISSWNAGAQRFKGYTASEIIGENFSRFYTPEDRAAGLPKRTLSIAAERGAYESEGWRVRKDGTRFWAHVIVDAIRDPAGQLIGFAKITRDLTERKAAEEQLRQSQEQFRMLVQGVTDYAIYMLDPEGYVESWNAGAERIKGYKAEEIIGQHFSKFYLEDDRKSGEPEKALATAAREGRFEKESHRCRKDGTRFMAHVIIDRIQDEKGHIIGFAKITRDITEREEARRALEKTREQLFQSQKVEAIGKLTGGVAHDFNNLLMVIHSSLELLRKRAPDNAQITPLIQNAMRATERGTALTHRMLAFARRQDISVTSVNVSKLLVDLQDLLKRSLGPAYLIKIDVTDPAPFAYTDSNQLENALLNLCFNARDAMPEGGMISISASTVQTRDDYGRPNGKYVSITVKDTGHGMDAETLRQATDPFFTTKGIGKGTGLGLSMVQGMAEQSGGSFKLSSEMNAGTTAEILLPVASSGMPEGEADTAVVPGVGKGPLLIVNVDDDLLVLMSTTAMLEDLGHKVLEANSGAEALELIRKNEVDLVITDFAMPKMSGAQLAKAMEAEKPGIPILLATGYAEIDPAIGVNLPRVSKPFTQRELKTAIDAILGPKAEGTG
jgi:PAS domain S-box-containing protein